MTDKEELFALEYLIDLNPYQAAIRAGYKERTAQHAYEWLQDTLSNPTSKRHLPFKPYLKEYIDEKLDKIKSDKIADATEVLEFFTSVMRGEIKEETLRFVGDGVQRIDEIASSTRERCNAAERLGKYYSLFTDKMRIAGNTQVVILDDIPEGESNA